MAAQARALRKAQVKWLALIEKASKAAQGDDRKQLQKSMAKLLGEVGAALEEGTALAFMGEENLEYGIDRIVAVAEDGRGWVWHQINHCGEKVFDGQPAPEDCPTPPDRY